MSIEFLYRLDHSYKKYIEQQYLKENIDVVVSKNVREAVGTLESIYGKHAAELNYRIGGIQDSLEAVNINLSEIGDRLDVVNSNIVSGFQSLFVQMDEVNAQLAHLARGIDTLVEIARTPVQTWSLNYYEIARDMVRQRLYPEALQALEFAINGKDQQPGYNADFRFHKLRGAILLGIPGKPESAATIDLRAAEKSFLLASKYARYDHKAEAAQGYVGAGKAAYADGRLEEAATHHQAALFHDAACGEANFQMARLCMHAEDIAGAERFLCAALDVHWSFAMRAGADLLFIANGRVAERSIEIATNRIIEHVAPRLKAIGQDLELIEQNSNSLLPPNELPTFKAIHQRCRVVSDNLTQKKLKNVFESRMEIERLNNDLRSSAKEYCDQLEFSLDQLSVSGLQAPGSLSDDTKKFIKLSLASLAVFLWIILFYEGLTRVRPGTCGYNFCNFWEWSAPMLPGTIAAMVVAAAYHVTIVILRRQADARLSRYTEKISGNRRDILTTIEKLRTQFEG